MGMLKTCHGQMIVDVPTATCVRASPAAEAALAQWAVEHVTPACGSRGHVLVRLSRTSSACAERQHAVLEVERSLKCPAGDRVHVDLVHHSASCTRRPSAGE